MLLYRVDMYADDEDHAVVSLDISEAKAVMNFLTQVKEKTRGSESWRGGTWNLVGPFETEEEAWEYLRDGKRRKIATARSASQ